MFIDQSGNIHMGDAMPGERAATVAEAAAFIANHERMVARDRINTECDATIEAGVEWNGNTWHTDTTFLTEMLGRILAWSLGLYAPGDTKPVRTKSNLVLYLTRDEHIALTAAAGAHREAAYSASWAAKDAL